MQTVKLQLPRPHQAQQRIIAEARRFNVIPCGRRFGKTTLGIDRAVPPALESYPVGWFSPTYKMLTEVWRDAKNALRPVASRISEQEHRIELITNGVLEMWSLDNPGAGRSRKYKRVIIDEAGLVKNLEEAWTEAIRPTLTDFKGDAWFFGTPKGRNFFWTGFNHGLDPALVDWACWQMPTTANPFIDPLEVEAARLELPERVYRQEYLAEFLEDAGGVFRGVSEVVDNGRSINEPPKEGRSYTTGIDLARVEDFTAISVSDDSGRQVYTDRFNHMSWERQAAMLADVITKYGGIVFVDSTGVGDPVIEQIRAEAYKRRSNATIEGILLTNTTKTQMIDALAMAIERREISLMDIPIQTSELQAYQYEITPSRNIRMNAPVGMHDDTVIAKALDHWCRVRPRVDVRFRSLA